MNTAAIETNWVGQLINGKFPLRHWLGGSQRSAVFLTELEKSRKAAIKLVPADPATAETLFSRWQATMALSHPHLVRLYDAGICEIDATPLLYVVMEFAEEDLSQVIPSRPLTAVEMGEMLPPLLDGLSCIHEKRLLHGRIKPSNIMAVNNQLKLSSDSIQAPGEFGAGGREPGMFDAPEAATGAIQSPADVWSLGVTLVTALTQHPPTWERAGKLVLPDTIPTAFRAVARECLRRDPAERCTLEQIRSLLRPPSVVLQPVQQPAKRVEPPAATVRPKPKRVAPPAATVRSKRGVTPIIAGLLLLAVLAGIILVMRRNQPPPTQPTGAEKTRPAQIETKPAAGVASRQSRTAQPQPSVTSRPPANAGPPDAATTSKAAMAGGAVAQQVLPDVPTSARNTIRGTVRVNVRVFVGPDGKVSEATLDSPGPSRYFANLALQAARDWKFKPPQVNRSSVASAWILHFQFGRTDTQVVPVQVTP